MTEEELQARVAESERRWMDGEELSEFDWRVLAFGLNRGGCHACGAEQS